jgi:membrane protease subunit HflK
MKNVRSSNIAPLSTSRIISPFCNVVPGTFYFLLGEYQKAPEVTRERLYIEAVEEVYGNASKVIVDSDGSGNLLYLPIDKLLEDRRNEDSTRTGGNTAASDAAATEADASRDNARERRTR